MLLSSANDALFCIHQEENRLENLFVEKSRLELNWKPNCFVVIGEDVFLGGVSSGILRANGIFRMFCVCCQESKCVLFECRGDQSIGD